MFYRCGGFGITHTDGTLHTFHRRGYGENVLPSPGMMVVMLAVMPMTVERQVKR